MGSERSREGAAVAILDANGVRLAGAGAKITVGTILFCTVIGTLVTVEN